MKQKYIRHSTLGFILWNGNLNNISHKEMASLAVQMGRKFSDKSEIISAGFVMFYGEGEVMTFGFSDSLNLGPLPDDANELSKQLGIEWNEWKDQ